MSGRLRKRSWASVHVEAVGQDFAVRLDAHAVRLANGATLRMASRGLAEAVALEWSLAGGGEGGLFGTEDLVLTGLAGTMQEHVAPAPGAAADRLLGFARSELLCCRAAYPAALAALQDAAWQPWLDWLRAVHGIELAVSRGIMPGSQTDAALAMLRQRVGALSPAVLTGLGVIVPALGSLVLGLALAAGRLDAAEAFRLSRLDEDFQASHWGVDREAAVQAARLGVEVAVAARFMQLADG